MENSKLKELRAQTIEGIERLLDELYAKLPSLPDDFAEVEGTMDDFDILGHPEGPDLLDFFPETYRWLELNENEDSKTSLSVFWFDNDFIPHGQRREIQGSKLTHVIEIWHEFGKVDVFKQKGEWHFVSAFITEANDTEEVSKAKRIEGVAGLSLLQRVHLYLVESYSIYHIPAKLQVHGVKGKEDFSVPKEFEEYSASLFAKDSITEREFVDFCLLATKLIDKKWDKRQGMAYHIAGAWIKYKNIDADDLLQQIGVEFGELELPDHHAAGSEEDVRDKWQSIKESVLEADKKFPEKTE